MNVILTILQCWKLNLSRLDRWLESRWTKAGVTFRAPGAQRSSKELSHLLLASPPATQALLAYSVILDTLFFPVLKILAYNQHGFHTIYYKVPGGDERCWRHRWGSTCGFRWRDDSKYITVSYLIAYEAGHLMVCSIIQSVSYLITYLCNYSV